MGVFDRRAAIAALVIATIVGSACASCVLNTPAQISSSVFLSGSWDYMDWAGNGQSNCITMVNRIASNNVHQIQFVPTFHWWDVGPLSPPADFDPTCPGTDLGGYYCFDRFNATEVDHWCYDIDQETGECPEVTDVEISNFVTNMGECMAHAVKLGLNVAINARVDDGRQLGGWRNTLDFDPLEKYGGLSYLEAVLYPLADAVAIAANATTRIDFVLQGEMGATVFSHPDSWQEVKTAIESRVLATRPDLGSANLKFGLGLNNNKLCGCLGIGIENGLEYLAFFPDAFREVESSYDLPAIRATFEAYDFVGLSAYVPMTAPNFTICEFEGLMVRLDYEFSFYGLTLKDLADQHKKTIHWIEFGIGGGASQSGNVPAPNSTIASYFPFYGMYGEYSCETDPFQGCEYARYAAQEAALAAGTLAPADADASLVDPAADANNARWYRQYYYSQVAKYLQQGGCSYSVDAVYIWNLESWDPQSVYPITFGDNQSEAINPDAYHDAVIAKTINAHNDAVTGGVVCSQSLSVATLDADTLSAASLDDEGSDEALADVSAEAETANLYTYADALALPGVPQFIADHLADYEGL